MAFPADYLDPADLKNVDEGGFVAEDVLRQIQDVSQGVKPVFMDMIATHSAKNSYSEWLEDVLRAPNTSNAAVSGASAPEVATGTTGLARVGNHAQTSVEYAYFSQRFENTDNFGLTVGERTAKKLVELKRDVEAIMLSNQASRADDNASTAGLSAGLGAWIKTHSFSGAGGSAGGFGESSATIVDAPTPGDARALTSVLFRTAIEELYEEGVENELVVMSVPGVIKRLSEFLRTDSTYNFVRPVANIDGTGGGVNQTAQGWTDTVITDFGLKLKLVANRLQPVYNSGDQSPVPVANLFILDTTYLAKAFLHDFKVEPIAKVGLGSRRQLSVDWMLKPLLERAQAVIRDISPTAAVTAT